MTQMNAIVVVVVIDDIIIVILMYLYGLMVKIVIAFLGFNF